MGLRSPFIDATVRTQIIDIGSRVEDATGVAAGRWLEQEVRFNHHNDAVYNGRPSISTTHVPMLNKSLDTRTLSTLKCGKCSSLLRKVISPYWAEITH